MQYLGNGGWVFRRGADTIATAPFVTNPAGLAIYFPARSDVDRVRARAPPMPDVRAILIGHAHYDHAMDLPAVMRDRAPSARLVAILCVAGFAEVPESRAGSSAT